MRMSVQKMVHQSNFYISAVCIVSKEVKKNITISVSNIYNFIV